MKKQENKKQQLKNSKVRDLTEQELIKIDGGRGWWEDIVSSMLGKFQHTAPSHEIYRGRLG